MSIDPESHGFQLGGVRGDLFKSTAAYYSKYRRHCPDPVVEYLAETCQLDGWGRLLDVGCGTGQVFKPLAKYFNEVVGIDSDSAMIEEARATNVDFSSKTRLDCISAEELDKRFGSFRMVTFGSSFHWMNRPAVCKLVYEILEPSGWLVILCPGEFRSGTTTWELEIQNVLKEWLGPERRAGGGMYRQGELHQQILERSPFPQFKMRDIPIPEIWTINEIVGYLFSTSYASPDVLRASKENFEQAIRQRLLNIDPLGKYEKISQHTIILTQTPN